MRLGVTTERRGCQSVQASAPLARSAGEALNDANATIRSLEDQLEQAQRNDQRDARGRFRRRDENPGVTT